MVNHVEFLTTTHNYKWAVWYTVIFQNKFKNILNDNLDIFLFQSSKIFFFFQKKTFVLIRRLVESCKTYFPELTCPIKLLKVESKSNKKK